MDDITNVHQSITKALQEVRENKLSIRKAAAKYGVPRSTFHDRVTGKIAEGRVTKGPDPYLSTKEEKIIAEWCSNISKCGFLLKTDDLLNTPKNNKGYKTNYSIQRWSTGKDMAHIIF